MPGRAVERKGTAWWEVSPRSTSGCCLHRCGFGPGGSWWWWRGWDPGAPTKTSDSDPKSTCGAASRASQQFTFALLCRAGATTSLRGLHRWGTGTGREGVVGVRKQPGAASRQREQKIVFFCRKQMKTRDKIRSVAGGQGKRGAVFPSFRQRAFTYPVEQESGGSRAGGWRCALMCGTAELGAAGSSQEQKHWIQREIRKAH